MPILRRSKHLDVRAGFSFIELLVVTALLLILASAVVPLTTVSIQRHREMELRRSLREMRTAIDRYKDAMDLGVIRGDNVGVEDAGYPPDLDTLVVGVEILNDDTGRKMKFLRRIPLDPLIRSHEWGLRSYQDEPDSARWGGDNVYDVYSQSDGIALDGTRYREW